MRIKRFLFCVVLLTVAFIVAGCKTNFVKFKDNKAVELKVGETKEVEFETNLTVENFYAKVEKTQVATVAVDFAKKTLKLTAAQVGETNVVIGQKENDAVVAKLQVKVTKTSDTTAPHINGLVDGKIPGIEHLKGETVDFTQLPANVTAVDNVDGNVAITIDSMGTYNKDVAGTYTITYKAEDAAGNKKVVERIVVVKETLEVTLPDALAYTEEGKTEFIQVDYNNTEAFTKTPSGATFRFKDVIQVMTKEFYLAEVEENKASYGGKEPMFVYGVVIVLDKDFNFVMARMGNGVAFELDKEGKKYYKTTETGDPTIINKDLVWDYDGSKGGMLIGLADEIPNDGFVVIVTPQQPQKSRIFATRYVSHKGYNGGASSAKDIANTFPRPNLEVKHDYKVKIEMPPALKAPEIKYLAHKLSWEAVENAKGYALYKNDEVAVAEINALEFDLSTLELEITPEGQPGYKFQLKALTSDIFKYTDSALSNEIMYVKKNLQALATPELTIDDQKVTWNDVEGEEKYIVKLFIGKVLVKEIELPSGTTEFKYFENTEFVGKYAIEVIAVPNPENALQSLPQKDKIIERKVAKKFTSGDLSDVDTYEILANEYFIRRNYTDHFKPYDGIYIINNVYEYAKTNDKLFKEKTSAIVVLDKNNKLKLVRNILPNKEFSVTNTTANGWVENPQYTATGSAIQLSGINFVEGDKILIGRNGGNAIATYNGTQYTKTAKEVVAHVFIVKNDDFVALNESNGAWRTKPLDQFIKASEVVFQIA